MQWVTLLASPRTTLVALVLLVIAVALIALEAISPTLALAPVVFLLIVNLSVAIFVTDKIRHNTALLVFHLALLAIMLLAVTSRLSYLKGWLKLAEGEAFAELSGILHQGPLHTGTIEGIELVQGPIKIEVQGMKRRRTYSEVSIGDDNNNDSSRAAPMVISDQQGLTRNGYHLTLSHHHGFAPVFLWQQQGIRSLGVIKLPSFPYNPYGQALSWTLPGTGTELWLQLQLDDKPISSGLFTVPKTHKLIIRTDDQRYEVRPGDTLTLANGQLTYRELRQWIGYEVFYDWTMPWLLVSCLAAIVSLVLFLIQKWASTPWNTSPDCER